MLETVGQDNPAVTRFRELHPEARFIHTSFVPTTNEVDNMHKEMHNEQVRWPGAWYEFLQGALDYGDGKPWIEIWLEGQAQPLQYNDWLLQAPSAKVEKVVIANTIKDNKGLNPDHITQINHVEQVAGKKTLGRHGRGLSVATAAVIIPEGRGAVQGTGALAEKIVFESSTDKLGAWYAEAHFVVHGASDDSEPVMSLQYNQDKDAQSQQTRISVIRPNEVLIESLRNLKDWFLPANAAYEKHRLIDGVAQTEIIPNYTTLDAQLSTHYASILTPAAPAESHEQENLAEVGEPTRFEILNPDVVTIKPKVRAPVVPENDRYFRRYLGEVEDTAGQESSSYDVIYVDGLRVQLSHKSALLYAVWGFGDSQISSEQARRSNDSLRFEGNIHGLIEKALILCDNPTVWLQLFTALHRSRNLQESQLGSYMVEEGMKRSPETMVAVKQGWALFLEQQGLEENQVLVSDYMYEQEDVEENMVVVVMHSHAIFRVISQICGVQPYRDYIQNKRAQEAAAKAAEETRIELEAKRRREDALRQSGRQTEAMFNGESATYILRTEEKTALDAFIISKLLGSLAANGGKASYDAETGRLILTFTNLGPLPRKWLGINRLQSGLNDSVLALVDVIPNFDLDINVYGAEPHYVQFECITNGKEDFSVNSVAISTGLLDSDEERAGTVQLLVNCRYENEQEEVLLPIVEQLLAAQEPLLDESGTVNFSKYLKSKYPSHSDIEKISVTEQIKQAQEAQRQELEAIIEKYQQAGLPVPARIQELLAVLSGDKAFTAAAITVDTRLPHTRLPSFTQFNGLNGLSRYKDNNGGLKLLLEKIGLHVNKPKPQFELLESEYVKSNGLLVIGPDTATGVTLEDFQLQEVPFGLRTNDVLTLKFNIGLEAGVQSLPCPVGFKPVGWYHEKQKNSPTLFSGKKESGWYAITPQQDVQPGLCVYYQKNTEIDTTPPTEEEKRAPELDLTVIPQHWLTLLHKIKENTSLTAKQKVDIFIKAWTRAFLYTDVHEAFSEYKDMADSDQDRIYSETITRCVGDCGYAMNGLRGLLLYVGVPVRFIPSWYSNTGEYSATEDKNNLHAVVQVYLNGRWVYVEPQVGYVEPGYTADEIPAGLLEDIINIPAKPLHTLSEQMVFVHQMKSRQQLGTLLDRLGEAGARARDLLIELSERVTEKQDMDLILNSIMSALQEGNMSLFENIISMLKTQKTEKVIVWLKGEAKNRHTTYLEEITNLPENARVKACEEILRAVTTHERRSIRIVDAIIDMSVALNEEQFIIWLARSADTTMGGGAEIFLRVLNKWKSSTKGELVQWLREMRVEMVANVRNSRALLIEFRTQLQQGDSLTAKQWLAAQASQGRVYLLQNLKIEMESIIRSKLPQHTVMNT